MNSSCINHSCFSFLAFVYIRCFCPLRFTRILKSWFFSWKSITRWRWDVVAGLITGFITSLLSIALVGLLRPFLSFIRRLLASCMSTAYPSTVLLKRACFFAVYFSFMSWVTIQYVKRLGLS